MLHEAFRGTLYSFGGDRMETDATVARNETVSEEFDNLTDEEIVLRIKSGSSSAALNYLIHKYRNFVRAKARSYFLIGADREDIIQEGMIGLFKAIRDYEPGREASFATFAALCINRQMLNAIEASTREKMKPLNDSVLLTDPEFETELAAGSESPERIVLDQEAEHEMIQRIRGLLSPMEKCVLDYYLEGRNYREIAHILQKTPKSIDNALQRIRKKIGANLR